MCSILVVYIHANYYSFGGESSVSMEVARIVYTGAHFHSVWGFINTEDKSLSLISTRLRV